MKFDKDLVVKHHFWLLLLISFPIAFVGILLLMTTVSAQITKQKDVLNTSLKSLSNVPTTFNQNKIDARVKDAELALSKQNTVWGDAYKVQAPLFTWPKRVEDRFSFQNGLFANEIQILKMPEKQADWPEDKEYLLHGVFDRLDQNQLSLKDRNGKKVIIQRTPDVKITDPDQAAAALLFSDLKKFEGKLYAVTYQRGKYFNDRLTDSEQVEFARSYKPQQIHDLLKIVDPMDKRGNGVVQLYGWSYDPDSYPLPGMRFLNYVSADWDTNKDISQEAWIAQEDLWIQTEIFRLIRAANDSIGQFVRVDKGKPASTLR